MKTLLMAALLLGQTPAPAEPEAVEAIEEVEEIEEIEDIEEEVDFDDIEEVTGGAAAAEPPTPSLVGYFHPATTHFPIAWLMLLLLVELSAFFLGRKELVRAGYYLAVLSVLSFFPAGLTGFFRYWALEGFGSDMSTAATHRNLAIACAVLTLAIAGFRHFFGRAGFGRRFRIPYLALVLATTALVGVTGHWGGTMVFGPPPF